MADCLHTCPLLLLLHRTPAPRLLFNLAGRAAVLTSTDPSTGHLVCTKCNCPGSYPYIDGKAVSARGLLPALQGITLACWRPAIGEDAGSYLSGSRERPHPYPAFATLTLPRGLPLVPGSLPALGEAERPAFAAQPASCPACPPQVKCTNYNGGTTSSCSTGYSQCGPYCVTAALAALLGGTPFSSATCYSNVVAYFNCGIQVGFPC